MHGLASTIILLTAWLFSTGCTTSDELAERTQLSRHPIQESRMSDQPAAGYAASGVWRIRGARNTVYLAGTCHLVAEDEIPFPSPFYAAYQDCKEVYVEFDTLSFGSQIRTLCALPKMMRWMRAHRAELNCPRGRTLKDYLSTGMVERLQESYGEDYRKMKRMTPLGLVFWNDFALEEGGDVGGVDDLFTLLAYEDGKPVRALDDKGVLDLAVSLLDEMFLSLKRDIAERGADAVVEEHLLNQEEEDSENGDWRHGNLAVLEQELAEMKNETPALYERLLPERNRKWLPKIKLALQSKHNVMILVGAMHLAGEEGLLRMLSESGFAPEQMYGVDHPEPPAQPQERVKRRFPIRERHVWARHASKTAVPGPLRQ